MIASCKTQGRAVYSGKFLTENAPREEGPEWSEHHKTALGHYNSAAQFNATSLVVVVFGQFAILTLLESRATEWLTYPVWSLITVYLSIMVLGCYFILNYLMFAQFIEELRKYDGVAPLETLEQHMISKIRDRWVGLSWLKSGRRSILKWPCLNLIACVAYVIISVIVLWATMSLPVPMTGSLQLVWSYRRVATEQLRNMFDILPSILLIVIGAALGLVVAWWRDTRSRKLMRADERRERVYGPLYDELPIVEQKLADWRDTDASAIEWKEYQEVREKHLLYLAPKELRAKIRRLYDEKLVRFSERRRELLGDYRRIVMREIGTIDNNADRLSRITVSHLLEEWSSLTNEDQNSIEGTFWDAKKGSTLLRQFHTGEEVFGYFKKGIQKEPAFAILRELRDESLTLLAEIRKEIGKDLKG